MRRNMPGCERISRLLAIVSLLVPLSELFLSRINKRSVPVQKMSNQVNLFWQNQELLIHVRSNSVEEARKALSCVSDGNFVHDNTSPLIAAVETDSPQMCSMLIKSNKCNPDVRYEKVEYPRTSERKEQGSLPTLATRCKS